MKLGDHKVKILALLVSLNLIRGLIYSAVVPLWQAPDEPWHFEHVKLFYQKRGPVSWADRSPELQKKIIASMEEFGYWKFLPWAQKEDIKTGELHQLPLYYLVSASVLLFTEQRDLATQAYAVRFVSVLMGTTVVLLAYLSARTLFPNDIFLQIGIPGFIIFLPMHTHITSSINNDNLAELMTSLTIYLLTLILSRGLSLARIAALSLCLLLGFYTKRTFFFTTPIVLLAFICLVRIKPVKLIPLQKLTVITCVISVIVGMIVLWRGGFLLRWWNRIYYRLTYTRAYPSPLRMFEALRGLYLQYAEYIFKSFWAFFGWLTVELDPAWYGFPLAICLASLVGLFLLGFRITKGLAPFASWQKAVILLYVLSAFLILLLTISTFLIYEVEESFGWWAKGHMPQGRYLFSAIIPIATILMLGIREILPSRYRLQLLILCLTGFFLFDLLCLLKYIIPFFYG